MVQAERPLGSSWVPTGAQYQAQDKPLSTRFWKGFRPVSAGLAGRSQTGVRLAQPAGGTTLGRGVKVVGRTTVSAADSSVRRRSSSSAATRPRPTVSRTMDAMGGW